MIKISFVPEKLPVKIDYMKFISDISKAHIAIARFDSLLSQLPNPNFLERTFVTKEAVLSSQIEGTQATLEEVFKHEAEGDNKNEIENKTKDIREVLNYRAALKKGVEILKERPISENFIKELHSILLHSVRGHDKAPGELRKTQVYIGKPGTPIEEASFVPPTPNLIIELLSNFEKYLNSKEEKDELVQIAIAHYQFEAIHPFMDGNGRIGRLLISLFLYDRKIISRPLLYISGFFEEHRQEYYNSLRNVSENKDWESWIKFFLHAIETQAIKAQETSKKILELYRSRKEHIADLNSVYAINLLDAIFEHPIFSFKSIKQSSRVKNNQTLINIIKKFVKAGIIKEANLARKRNKIYIFNDLMKIIR